MKTSCTHKNRPRGYATTNIVLISMRSSAKLAPRRRIVKGCSRRGNSAVVAKATTLPFRPQTNQNFLCVLREGNSRNSSTNIMPKLGDPCVRGCSCSKIMGKSWRMHVGIVSLEETDGLTSSTLLVGPILSMKAISAGERRSGSFVVDGLEMWTSGGKPGSRPSRWIG